MLTTRIFSRLALVHLGFLLLVIVFGAYVRATGSGAGCGSHWPLCNGEVLPRTEQVKTMIEYTHRITSTMLLLFSLFLMWVAFKLYPKGHGIRKVFYVYLGILFVEILLGASLVLLGHVAENRSVYRGLTVSLHLVNTLMLSGAAFLLYCYSKYTPAFVLRQKKLPVFIFVGGVCLIFLTGISGAITALGDTLFPVVSMIEAISQSLSATEHLFVRFRIYHPFIAMFVSLYLVLSTWLLSWDKEDLRKYSSLMFGCFIGQTLLGYLNVYLHAPIWIQLVHLLVAHGVWLLYLLFMVKYIAGNRFELEKVL